MTPPLHDPRLAAFAQAFFSVGLAQLVIGRVSLELAAGWGFAVLAFAVYGGILAVGGTALLLHLSGSGLGARLGRLACAFCRSEVDLDDLARALLRLELDSTAACRPISSAAGCAAATFAMLMFWMGDLALAAAAAFA